MIGKTLRTARDARGWTQAELATQIGVSPKTVAAWESTGSSPSPPALARLEKAMPELSDAVSRVRTELAKRSSFAPTVRRTGSSTSMRARHLRRLEFARRRAQDFSEGVPR